MIFKDNHIRSYYQPAETADFTVIPQEVLDAGFKGSVHVEGWARGSHYEYVCSNNGLHILQTRKGKIETTRNRLMYTRKNQPAPWWEGLV